jgi:hypothetical protein
MRWSIWSLKMYLRRRLAFPTASRSKIDYLGYDVNNESASESDRLANAAGFRSHDVKIGSVTDVRKLLGALSFDFITFTNTVHEVHPRHLALVLVDAVFRLTAGGKLFIYDMEAVRPPELGAIPWTATEMTEIARQLVASLKVPNYEPPVGRWKHSSCDAWSVQIHRDHLGGSGAIISDCRPSWMYSCLTRITPTRAKRRGEAEAPPIRWAATESCGSPLLLLFSGRRRLRLSMLLWLGMLLRLRLSTLLLLGMLLRLRLSTLLLLGMLLRLRLSTLLL